MCVAHMFALSLTHVDRHSDPLRGKVVFHGVEELCGVGVLPQVPDGVVEGLDLGRPVDARRENSGHAQEPNDLVGIKWSLGHAIDIHHRSFIR